MQQPELFERRVCGCHPVKDNERGGNRGVEKIQKDRVAVHLAHFGAVGFGEVAR
jgi:hypothetical protein